MEDLEAIIRDWPEDWQHEGSLPLAEKSTQQADATMPGQAQPNKPSTKPSLQTQQKNAQNEEVPLEPSCKKQKANKESNTCIMDEE